MKEKDEENKSALPWESESQKSPSIYDEAFSAVDYDSGKFIAGIKRRQFFQTLKSIFAFHKHTWAKQTVIQTFKKVYL